MKLRCCGTGSNGNCYSLISDTGEILLLECGVSNWNKILRMINYRITDVSGCILTHIHSDHSKNVETVQWSGIRVFTNKETAEILSGKLTISSPEGKTVQIGNFKAVPFYVEHDGTPNYAFLIKHPECGTMLYATDFMYLNKYSFKNMRINHFLIECNHLDETPEQDSFKFEHSVRGHSSLSTVKEIIRVNKTASLRTITLCHLSEDWGDPDRMQKEIQEVAGKDVLVQIARVGLEVSLNLCPF